MQGGVNAVYILVLPEEAFRVSPTWGLAGDDNRRLAKFR